MDGLSGQRVYSGIGDCIAKTYRSEGLNGFFRGMPTTLIRSFPVNAVTFSVVTWFLRTFEPSPESSSVTYQDAASYQVQETNKASFAQDHQVFGWSYQNEWLSEWKTVAPALVMGGISPAGSIPIRNYTVHCRCTDWLGGAMDSLVHQVHNMHSSTNSSRTLAEGSTGGSTAAGLLYNCHCQEAEEGSVRPPVQVSPGDSSTSYANAAQQAVRCAAHQATSGLNANL